MPVDGDGPARSVVVTGASSGIGLATATQLARAGHMVVLGAHRAENCEKVAAKLRAEGATAFAAALDLSDASSIDSFVESARYLVGPVEVLVSNAGQSRPLAAATADHTLGAQHLAARLIPPMIERGSGDLVFISSKVEAWVAVLQAELEGTGVRASVVRPGHATVDVARVVASVINCPERTHLRLVEVVPSVPRTVEATN
jgi:short-subunit dehydrogenase